MTTADFHPPRMTAREQRKAKIRPAAVTDLMRMTPTQAQYYKSRSRFNVVPAGRRSGKTAIAKRRLVRKSLFWSGIPGARFVAAAPVQHQAKRIYWADIKRLVPGWARLKTNESDLSIELRNGAIIQVMGIDKPERAEGAPIAHFLFDEYANCKEEAWPEHIAPALTETQGTADFIGVPEGRNHYYELFRQAQQDKTGDWSAFWWVTADVLPMYLGPDVAKKELARARALLDALTYRQEYEADFNNLEGRIYYPFTREKHAYCSLPYNPNKPLILMLDFNTSPGVCAYGQEHMKRHKDGSLDREFTAIIGEAYIPRGSNTSVICRKILSDWSDGLDGAARIYNHRGEVHVYGDATGGVKTTQAVQGSDWDIVRDHLRPVFGENLRMRIKRANPRERVRVNAVNTRLETADGIKRLLVDPERAPRTVDDFEAVVAKEGTNGEIDKETEPKLTHISDAIGYYVDYKYPMGGGNATDISAA